MLVNSSGLRLGRFLPTTSMLCVRTKLYSRVVGCVLSQPGLWGRNCATTQDISRFPAGIRVSSARNYFRQRALHGNPHHALDTSRVPRHSRFDLSGCPDQGQQPTSVLSGTTRGFDRSHRKSPPRHRTVSRAHRPKGWRTILRSENSGKYCRAEPHRSLQQGRVKSSTGPQRAQTDLRAPTRLLHWHVEIPWRYEALLLFPITTSGQSARSDRISADSGCYRRSSADEILPRLRLFFDEGTHRRATRRCQPAGAHYIPNRTW